MPIVRDRDAVPHRLHGSTFHSYAAPATGSRELCAWRLEVPPGTVGAPHRVSREEVFLILGGRLTVTLDGVTGDLTPGDVLLVPAGAELRADNLSDGVVTAWVTTSVGLRATMADGSAVSPPWAR
jgi:quercetin dioxygenase-like cupin family protein